MILITLWFRANLEWDDNGKVELKTRINYMMSFVGIGFGILFIIFLIFTFFVPQGVTLNGNNDPPLSEKLTFAFFLLVMLMPILAMVFVAKRDFDKFMTNGIEMAKLNQN